MRFGAPLTALLAVLAAGVAVGGLSGASAIGTGDTLPTTIWSLAWPAGPLWREGLSTTLLAFPEGGRVLPELGVEGLLLAPVTWVFGATIAWNLLFFVRVAAGAFGGALLARRAGGSPLWGLATGLCPAWLSTVDEAGAGAMAWVPLALHLLSGDRGHSGRRALVAGLLCATAPSTGFAVLVGLAILSPLPGAPKTPWWTWNPVRIAAVFCSFNLAWWLWALMADPLWAQSAAALWGDVAELPRGGTLLGALGLGQGPRWGSPLLLIGLYPLFRPRDALARRAGLLVLVGVLLALGGALSVSGEPWVVNGRQLPLPALLMVSFPPFSAASEVVRYGSLAFVGVALLGARIPAFAPLCLALLLLNPWPGRSPTPAPVDLPGPRFIWPIESRNLALWRQTTDGVPVSSSPERGTSHGVAALVGEPSWSLAALQELLQKSGFSSVVLDLDAAEGQAAELRLLLGPTPSIAGASWPAVDLQASSFNPRKSVPMLPDTAGRLPASWNETDPDLQALLDPTLFDRALTRLTLYRSADGDNWEKIGDIAHSLTSLGVSVHHDSGEEVLLISSMVSLPLELGPTMPPLHSAAVVAITSTDLEQFGARFYWLDDRLAVIDSQIDSVPTEGSGARLELTSWIRTGGLGINPVALSGVHPVVLAPLLTGGKLGPPSLIYSAPWLADPVRVGPFLYYTELSPTRAPAVVIAEATDAGYTPISRLEGLTVPHVWRDGARWRLLAHGPGAGRRLTVVQSVSEDGRVWSPPTLVSAFTDTAQCESPVATRFRGGYVLACSARTGNLAQIEEAPGDPR